MKAAAGKMLGTKMATYQTAGVELPVNLVLVTTAASASRRLCCSVLVDRGTRTITYIASSEGGVEIEQVAADAESTRSTSTSSRACGRVRGPRSSQEWA